jgi:hypothetical protein
MNAVLMFIEKFGREVLIDIEHPLAVAQRLKDKLKHELASVPGWTGTANQVASLEGADANPGEPAAPPVPDAPSLPEGTPLEDPQPTVPDAPPAPPEPPLEVPADEPAPADAPQAPAEAPADPAPTEPVLVAT